MNKRGKGRSEKSISFFPKNRRGQFFLVATLIIIGVIAGFVTLSNSSTRKSDIKFSQVGEELEIEFKKVLDHGISQNFDDAERKALLTEFSENYSTYSDADGFYFLFGDEVEITFAGLKKKNVGTINIETVSNVLNTLDVDLEVNIFKTEDVLSGGTSVNLTVDGIKYVYNLTAGENFYFVVSKEVNGDIYTVSND